MRTTKRIVVIGPALLCMVMGGCSQKLAGEYVGTLIGLCGIKKMTNVQQTDDGSTTATVTRCSGGNTTSNYVLAVTPAKGERKFQMVLAGCAISLSEVNGQLDVDSNQKCPLDVNGYTGGSTPVGQISIMDDDLNMSVSFLATDEGASGGYVFTFEGKRKK